MMRSYILVLMLSTLACAHNPKEENGRYSMESAGKSLYVLDSRTGRVWSVVGGAILNAVPYSQVKSASWKMDDVPTQQLPTDPK